jgi:hypothetical protein
MKKKNKKNRNVKYKLKNNVQKRKTKTNLNVSTNYSYNRRKKLFIKTIKTTQNKNIIENIVLNENSQRRTHTFLFCSKSVSDTIYIGLIFFDVFVVIYKLRSTKC